MTTTGYIGSPTGNVIVPITNFTKSTKAIALTTSDITAGTNVSSITYVNGKIICFSDSAGVWFARVNVEVDATFANASGWVLNFPYLTFANNNDGWKVDATIDKAGFPLSVTKVNPNLSTMNIAATTTFNPGTTAALISFTVPLASEPTTYTTAANMEGNVNVSAYFPVAAGATPGLVDGNAATWNGVKTFSSGILLPTTGGTAATLSFYAEDTTTLANAVWYWDGTHKTSTVLAGIIVRCGRQVTILFNDSENGTPLAQASCQATLSNGTVIYLPTWATPAAAINVPVPLVSGGSFTSVPGLMQIANTGSILLYASMANANWTAVGASGLGTTSVTYIV